MDSIEWPSYIRDVDSLKNPYYFAFRSIINVLAQNQTKLGMTEPVDFIFDEESEKKYTLQYWDNMKIYVLPEVRKLMGNIPIYRKDEEAKPLQAADLFAWWARKWVLDGITNWPQTMPFPWSIKRELIRFNMDFDENDFRTEFEKYLTPEARQRALMTPQSKEILSAIERAERGFPMTLPDPTSPLKWAD